MSKKTNYSILYKLGTSENYKSLVRKDFLCMDYFYPDSTFGRYTFLFWYVHRCHMFYYRWSIRSNSSTLSRQKITLYIYTGIQISFMYYICLRNNMIFTIYLPGHRSSLHCSVTFGGPPPLQCFISIISFHLLEAS